MIIFSLLQDGDLLQFLAISCNPLLDNPCKGCKELTRLQDLGSDCKFLQSLARSFYLGRFTPPYFLIFQLSIYQEKAIYLSLLTTLETNAGERY